MKGLTSSVVRMLEMRSIDVEAKAGEFRSTCLMNATWFGHLDICRLLLDKGALVDSKDNDSWTPLHLAAQKDLIEIIHLLRDRGADVEARDNIGWRPLHFAAGGGSITAVIVLIEEMNVEINAITNDGKTSLSLSSRDDVTTYLISHGGIV